MIIPDQYVATYEHQIFAHLWDPYEKTFTLVRGKNQHENFRLEILIKAVLSGIK